jgi:hypothetical protein
VAASGGKGTEALKRLSLDSPAPAVGFLQRPAERNGWRVGSLAAEAASKDQMLAVLSSLDRLRIRGEFITGADNGDLDNVVLNGVPEDRFPGANSLILGVSSREIGFPFLQTRAETDTGCAGQFTCLPGTYSPGNSPPRASTKRAQPEA